MVRRSVCGDHGGMKAVLCGRSVALNAVRFLNVLGRGGRIVGGRGLLFDGRPRALKANVRAARRRYGGELPIFIIIDIESQSAGDLIRRDDSQ